MLNSHFSKRRRANRVKKFKDIYLETPQCFLRTFWGENNTTTGLLPLLERSIFLKNPCLCGVTILRITLQTKQSDVITLSLPRRRSKFGSALWSAPFIATVDSPTVMLKVHSLQSRACQLVGGPEPGLSVPARLWNRGPLHSRVRQLGVKIRSHPHSLGHSTPKQNWGPSIRAACGYSTFNLHTQMHKGAHADIFRSDPSAKAGYSEEF